MSKNIIKETTGYSNALKNWVPKLMGPKVTKEMLETVHKLGCRAGKQALARAMEMRSCGASDGQIKAACIAGWGSSGSHHNKRRDLIAAKLVRRIAIGNSDSNGHTVYTIELTDKGKTKIGVEKPVVEVQEIQA